MEMLQRKLETTIETDKNLRNELYKNNAIPEKNV